MQVALLSRVVMDFLGFEKCPPERTLSESWSIIYPARELELEKESRHILVAILTHPGIHPGINYLT